MSENTSQKKPVEVPRFRFKSKFLIGGVITAIYLFLILILVFKTADYSGDKGGFFGLTLNEWGDFLAGAFAPPAFLWLILGYLQQGEELKHSTEALKAQKEELNRLALLAEVNERQKAVRECPIIELTLTVGLIMRDGLSCLELRLDCHSNTMLNIRETYIFDSEVVCKNNMICERLEPEEFINTSSGLVNAADKINESHCYVCIDYTDVSGRPYKLEKFYKRFRDTDYFVEMFPEK